MSERFWKTCDFNFCIPMLRKFLKKISSKNTFLKKSYKSFFVFLFVFSLFLGFGPIGLLKNYLGAFGTELRVVSFYSISSKVSENDDYSLGWWNQENSMGKPSISPRGAINDFSDSNSAFYSGGNFALYLLDFNTPFFQTPTSTAGQIEIINEETLDDAKYEPINDSSVEKTIDEDQAKTDDLSFFNIFPPSALAQENSSYAHLGKFDSAKINFSMALESYGTNTITPQEELDNATSSPSLDNQDNLLEGEIIPDTTTTTEADLGAVSPDLPSGDVSQSATSSHSTQESVNDAETIILEDDSSQLENIVEIIEEESGAVEVQGEDESQAEETPQVQEEEVFQENEEVITGSQTENSESSAPDNNSPEDNTPEASSPEINNSETSSSEEGVISKLFSVKKVSAQELREKFSIWYSVSSDSDIASTSASTTTEKEWHLIETVYSDELSNYLNNGFFSYDLPLLTSWEDVENLKIKIEGASEGGSDFLLYIDSVWIDVLYEKDLNAPELPEEKEQRWSNMLELLSSQKVFKSQDDINFHFKYNKNKKSFLDGLGESLGISDYWKDIDLRVEIFNSKDDLLDLPVTIIFEENGEFRISFFSESKHLIPGDYKIKFYVKDESGAETEELFFEEKFSWGVLAMNMNKSVYAISDDSAFLQMAVLDNLGHTICDADLTLEIISPEGGVRILDTSNETIIRNELCGPDNVIDSPDYYAFFQFSEVGDYELLLKAKTNNGTKEIKDSFRVASQLDYSIERTGPTRIYPLANYEMKINILANQKYSGNIYEYMPAGFYIVNQEVKIKKASSSEFVYYNDEVSSSTKHYSYDEINTDFEKEIIWGNLFLEEGDELEIVYEFDAPNISPELYFLGPASISTTTEERQWQIASDAISTYNGDNGISIGWTNPSNAWDATNNTYATRAIPRRSAVDSGNYLLVTSNTATDLGGAISSVEIGVKGYVQATAVTTYIVPVIGGVDGTTYNIIGTTMGTTDNGAYVYLNITSEVGTWTWSDIINMDIRLYGNNSANGSDNTLYIDNINIRVDYTTNNLPTGTFVSAVQKTGVLGVADLQIQVNDIDGDDSRAKIEYVAGAECDFTSPLKAYLDENDATATSTDGDAKIDNNLDYQIGSSTGWILTSGGANNIYFDWLTLPTLEGEEATYCLRLTANDMVSDQETPATTTISIDNKNPTAPGVFSLNSHAKNSLTLNFGATTTETNFKEYKIFWKEYDGTAPTETDNEVNSLNDINLADINFNGVATTTISGLSEATQYSFSLWAYDDYGRKASSSFSSFYTNNAPISSFNSASQRIDASGRVDISINVDDGDNDNSIARLDYVLGSECDFSSPLDPTLDQTQSNISSTYGVPRINNSNVYQIGEPDWWISTPDVNTIQFDWLSQADLSGQEGIYCLQLNVNDGEDDQNIPATTTLMIDNATPSSPGQLSVFELTGTTIKLLYGTSSTDLNFSHYKIFYKQGVAGVTEGDTEHIDSNLSDINYNGTSSTTISGLTLNTDYVINIWAYDIFGNKISSTEITTKTNASITNDSLVFVNPLIDNVLIANGEDEWTFRASVSDVGGQAEINNINIRLANSIDNTAPFSDLEFSWNRANNIFTEVGSDLNSAVSISPNSTSTCAINTCTVDFILIFDHNFATSTIDYAAELYSTNNSSSYDNDIYTDFYQVRLKRVEQAHYRWRNDDGGE